MSAFLYGQFSKCFIWANKNKESGRKKPRKFTMYYVPLERLDLKQCAGVLTNEHELFRKYRLLIFLVIKSKAERIWPTFPVLWKSWLENDYSLKVHVYLGIGLFKNKNKALTHYSSIKNSHFFKMLLMLEILSRFNLMSKSSAVLIFCNPVKYLLFSHKSLLHTIHITEKRK